MKKLDHEKLDVYIAARELLLRIVSMLVQMVRRLGKAGTASLPGTVTGTGTVTGIGDR